MIEIFDSLFFPNGLQQDMDQITITQEEFSSKIRDLEIAILTSSGQFNIKDHESG